MRMNQWKIAGVQMDCTLGGRDANLAAVVNQLRGAAREGARLAIFPECVLPGYCFASLAEALPHAETIPGPSTEALARACRELDVYAVVGLLETDRQSGGLYN